MGVFVGSGHNCADFRKTLKSRFSRSESRLAGRHKKAQRFRGCYETLSSLRDSYQTSHWTQHLRLRLRAGLKLLRACGTRISWLMFHRRENKLSFVTDSSVEGWWPTYPVAHICLLLAGGC